MCPHCGHEAGGFVTGAETQGARVDAAAAVGRAFRLFGQKWPLLVAIWGPAIAIELLASLALGAYQRSTGIVIAPEMAMADQLRLLGVAAPLALLGFTVQLALWGAIAAVALGKPRASLFERPGPYLTLGLVLTFLYLAGAALLVVPFFVFFHWFLYAPAAMADAEGRTGAALDASRAFSRRMRTFGFTALVLFVWLGTVLVALGAAAVVSLAGERLGVEDPFLSETAGTIAGGLVAPIVPLLPACYWALARDARPQAPTPDAMASERFRTTKCPQCGALVPYTATGNPVDVTCPICGRSGRVL